MKENLKSIINTMSKEQLVEIIEQMCNVPETERLLKLMLMPSEADIDRALRKFSAMCESYVCNSCSSRRQKAMYDAAEPLRAAYKYADERTCAYITYGMHEAMEEKDLLYADGGYDYYNIIGDMLVYLEDILKQSPALFSSEEFKLYSSIVELYD